MQPINRNRPVGASQKTGRSGQRVPREPFLSGLAVTKTITIKSRVGKVRAGDQLEPSLEDDWLLSEGGFNRSLQHYDHRSSGEGCRPLRARRGSANLPRVAESLGLSDTSTQQTAPSPRETFRCQNSADTEGERQAEPASAAFLPPGFQGRPTIRVTPADIGATQSFQSSAPDEVRKRPQSCFAAEQRILKDGIAREPCSRRTAYWSACR
ncbi:hypothetical protein HDG38_000237 [Paraburkholderia sp. WSM4177]|nr:hypothetical protein [Paraburkholderia sp. WSM4177]MBB5482043.1 hypothetical protein [Paraburkholderia sp. WSM4180]